MTSGVEHYAPVARLLMSREGGTLLVLRGATRTEVEAALQIDPTREILDFSGSVHVTGWGLLSIPGAVLAFEATGYGDPSPRTLAALSTGGVSAVVRDNIQGNHRFGFAVAGRNVFDSNHYPLIDDPRSVPEAFQALLRRAWCDPEDDDRDDDANAVALAMAEVATGVPLALQQVSDLMEQPQYAAPALRYLRDGYREWRLGGPLPD